MRLYNSFLIRSWIIAGDEAEPDCSVFDVEHMQTSEHARAANLGEVRRLIEERLHIPRPPPDAPPPDGDAA